MAFMTYEGIRDNGTFKLDSGTKGKVASNPDVLVGKTVAFVNGTNGEPEVGYGTAKALMAGVVTAWEYADANKNDIVVTVSRNCVFDNISTASSSTTAAVGAGVVVDGKGGVETSTSASNAVCIALATAKTSCMIWVY